MCSIGQWERPTVYDAWVRESLMYGSGSRGSAGILGAGNQLQGFLKNSPPDLLQLGAALGQDLISCHACFTQASLAGWLCVWLVQHLVIS